VYQSIKESEDKLDLGLLADMTDKFPMSAGVGSEFQSKKIGC
jgi:hypothetical protein